MVYFVPQLIECPDCDCKFEYSQSSNYFGLIKDKDGNVLCPHCLAEKLKEIGVPVMAPQK